MNVRIFWVRAMKCMCAQTRPRFILSSERVFGGMEFEPMLTPREKSPLPENFPRGGSNPWCCGQRAQTLPTSYSGPPASNAITVLQPSSKYATVGADDKQSFTAWNACFCLKSQVQAASLGNKSFKGLTYIARFGTNHPRQLTMPRNQRSSEMSFGSVMS